MGDGVSTGRCIGRDDAWTDVALATMLRRRCFGRLRRLLRSESCVNYRIPRYSLAEGQKSGPVVSEIIMKKGQTNCAWKS